MFQYQTEAEQKIGKKEEEEEDEQKNHRKRRDFQ